MRHRIRRPDGTNSDTPHIGGPFRDDFFMSAPLGAASGARSVADADAPNLAGTWRLTNAGPDSNATSWYPSPWKHKGNR